MDRRLRPYTAAGAAAASLAAVLVLAGCGASGGDALPSPAVSGVAATVTTTGAATGGTAAVTGGGPSGKSTSSAVPSGATPTASGSGATQQGVEGVWLASAGATKVQLVLGKGEAGLTSTSLCGGSYTEKNGIGLTLTCVDGNKTRTSGHGVLAADGQTLTVTWTGGLTDTFSRTDLPSS